jgi:hypothetical protein
VTSSPSRIRWSRAAVALIAVAALERWLSPLLVSVAAAVPRLLQVHWVAVILLAWAIWITSSSIRHWVSGDIPPAIPPAVAPPRRRPITRVRVHAQQERHRAVALATPIGEPMFAAGSGARLCIMGPEHAELQGRVDPFTRTRFAAGQRFVLCEACGAAYTLATCEYLQYRCPTDGTSLRVA